MEKFSFDWTSLAGPSESEAAQAEADFNRGYETASVMALTIDKQIREAYPEASPAFIRGVMDGIRKEI